MRLKTDGRDTLPGHDRRGTRVCAGANLQGRNNAKPGAGPMPVRRLRPRTSRPAPGQNLHCPIVTSVNGAAPAPA